VVDKAEGVTTGGLAVYTPARRGVNSWAGTHRAGPADRPGQHGVKYLEEGK